MKRNKKSSKDFTILSGNIPSLIIGSLVLLFGSIIVGGFTRSTPPTPTSFSSVAILESVAKSPLAHEETNNQKDTKIYYTAQKGDGLARIGFKLCGQKNAWLYIAEENNKYPPFTVSVGETLTIACK